MSFGAPGGRAINIKPTPYVHYLGFFARSMSRCSPSLISTFAFSYSTSPPPHSASRDCFHAWSRANLPNSRPERGSFPLDHDAECKHIISSYLRCLKKPRAASGKIQAGVNDEECRIIAKEYLQCRMDRNLMAKDEMKNLGLDFPSQSTVPSHLGDSTGKNGGTEHAKG
jgi:cytochrome c oxidase assembly protein subunit 19